MGTVVGVLLCLTCVVVWVRTYIKDGKEREAYWRVVRRHYSFSKSVALSLMPKLDVGACEFCGNKKLVRTDKHTQECHRCGSGYTRTPELCK